MRYREIRNSFIMENTWAPTPYDEFMSSLGENQKSGRELAKFVTQNCRKWLSEIGVLEHVFYRGLKTFNTHAAGVIPIRKNRPPRDSSMYQHQAFMGIIRASGGVANRDNSAFVTSNHLTSAEYGTNYVFMPIGKYHYTWSAEWVDWTTDMDSYDLMNLLKPEVRIDRYAIGPKNGEKVLETFSNPNNYLENISKSIMVDQGLKEAWNKQHEVMVSAKYGLYILPNYYHDLVKPFLEDPGLEPKDSDENAIGIILNLATRKDQVQVLLVKDMQHLQSFIKAMSQGTHQKMYTNSTSQEREFIDKVFRKECTTLAVDILWYPLNIKNRKKWAQYFDFTPEQLAGQGAST